MVQLMAKLGMGRLPVLTDLALSVMPVGNAGSSAHSAPPLGRGALPRLRVLELFDAAIGNAGLCALAPALRKLPALEVIGLSFNPFGDEGVAALLAPPPARGRQVRCRRRPRQVQVRCRRQRSGWRSSLC